MRPSPAPLLLALAACGNPAVDTTRGTASPAAPATPTATAAAGPWLGAWTFQLHDDENCVPTAPFEVTLGPATARRPSDAGPGGEVRAEGKATLVYADARGTLAIDVFVLSHPDHVEWWLERRTDHDAVSAVFSTATGSQSPFTYSVIGDCLAIDRVCACISRPTWSIEPRR